MIVSGLRDIRHLLERNVKGGPLRYVPIASKRGVVLHYFGPPVPESVDEIAYFRSIAHNHAFVRDWGGGQHGDGIMYHIGIGRSGIKYHLRNLGDVLWHCGTSLNTTAFAVHVMLGGDQRATPAQLRATDEVCRDIEAAGQLTRQTLWGHVELGTTGTCPGTLMRDFVYPWRSGNLGGDMADGHYFTETGHFIGGGFWQFWSTRGGLPVFGYPLTDEMTEDGRTVQYFERAVFEFWPENDDPHRILLRRLGAEALARRAA